MWLLRKQGHGRCAYMPSPELHFLDKAQPEREPEIEADGVRIICGGDRRRL